MGTKWKETKFKQMIIRGQGQLRLGFGRISFGFESWKGIGWTASLKTMLALDSREEAFINFVFSDLM